jgi:Kef-type K+ transport system membrane component KefB
MTPFLQLAFLLVVILLTAKLAGYAAIRLGQPSVLGELLVGVVLGPSLINLLHLPMLDSEAAGEVIRFLAEMGVLFLMFLAGLELHTDELRHTAKVSALAGTLGVVLPVLLGWGTGLLFGLGQLESIFLGLTLGATSVSISAQTLMELNVLRSRVGLGLLGAAVFDDILVILFLSLFFAFTAGETNTASILLVVLRMALFFGAAGIFGIFALPSLIKWVRNLPISQNVLSLALVTLLVYALAAELLGGMAAITGAFLAGLMFARSPERENLEPRVRALAYGFFVPVFFVSIGLAVDMREISGALGLTLVLIIVAISSKWLGAGLGAKWAGFPTREAAQLGAGMVSRGEVGLIVAAVGLEAGLVVDAEFAALVSMVIVTTLVTPPLLKAAFSKSAMAQEAKEPEV